MLPPRMPPRAMEINGGRWEERAPPGTKIVWMPPNCIPCDCLLPCSLYAASASNRDPACRKGTDSLQSSEATKEIAGTTPLKRCYSLFLVRVRVAF